MRRTTTTLSRFTTFITNWWANPGRSLNRTTLLSGLVILVLLSCEDDSGLVGLKNPNRDFEVFSKEFSIPTTVFQADSLTTANGGGTASPQRLMAGQMTDPAFGSTTAIAYMQYYPTNTPTVINKNAVFEALSVTLIHDFYWQGDKSTTGQRYVIKEFTDSLLSYKPYFSNQSVALGAQIGQYDRQINPEYFDQSILDNADEATDNDIVDSVNFDLDSNLGQQLLAAAMDTVGQGVENFFIFERFRRKFKGFAIVPTEADKIVGFDHTHSKSRITLFYRIDTTEYQMTFRFDASGQNRTGVGEYLSFTELKTDRSGTPLAALPPKYQDYFPSDGMRYIQAGTGLSVKLDFTEVRDHFKNIPLKALSAAELKIETEQQVSPPTRFVLRALKPNNRLLLATKGGTDVAGDPQTIIDNDYLLKHSISQNSLARVEPISDEDRNSAFTLKQISNESTGAVYTGYITTFLQQETTLSDTDFLRYFALIPQTPDNTKSINGFYFPAENVKLKIYYTVPKSKE